MIHRAPLLKSRVAKDNRFRRHKKAMCFMTVRFSGGCRVVVKVTSKTQPHLEIEVIGVFLCGAAVEIESVAAVEISLLQSFVGEQMRPADGKVQVFRIVI